MKRKRPSKQFKINKFYYITDHIDSDIFDFGLCIFIGRSLWFPKVLSKNEKFNKGMTILNFYSIEKNINFYIFSDDLNHIGSVMYSIKKFNGATIV